MAAPHWPRWSGESSGCCRSPSSKSSGAPGRRCESTLVRNRLATSTHRSPTLPSPRWPQSASLSRACGRLMIFRRSGHSRPLTHSQTPQSPPSVLATRRESGSPVAGVLGSRRCPVTTATLKAVSSFRSLHAQYVGPAWRYGLPGALESAPSATST
jgi:hypothetical protein